jgi:putative modified peptide
MIKGAPSNDAIAKVLGQLSTDRDFREQVLGDPVSALKPHGIAVDAADVPPVRSLPSMAEVAKIHQQFLDNPQDKSCIMVFIVIGAK